MLQKLKPTLMVEDVRLAAEFYRDVLGFTLVLTVPPEGEGFWEFAILERDGIEIRLQESESLIEEVEAFRGMPIGGTLMLYFEIQGIDSFYQRVQGQALILREIHQTPHHTREFTLQDPNGYVLTFAERR